MCLKIAFKMQRAPNYNFLHLVCAYSCPLKDFYSTLGTFNTPPTSMSL